MKYSLKTSITSSAGAKLLLSNEICLKETWPLPSAKAVLNELLLLQIRDFLILVDNHRYGCAVNVQCIPQFGKIENLAKVPYYFVETGEERTDYAQLGFYLKKDVHAKLNSNIKFGENHGKGAALLGLVNCINSRITPSSLSRAFCTYPYKTQEEIIMRLFFRIPIVQIILKEASYRKINGYSPMEGMKKSTMRRRGQCLRSIFKMMQSFQSSDLDMRIKNILWNDSEVN